MKSKNRKLLQEAPVDPLLKSGLSHCHWLLRLVPAIAWTF